MSQVVSAIVAGVGPVRGLGAALASCFAEKGLHVFIAGRSGDKLNEVTQHIEQRGGSVTSVVADITVDEDVRRLFEIVRSRGDPIEIAAYSVDSNNPVPFLETDTKTFAVLWR